MGHRHAQREAGAARGELQVGQPVHVRAGQVGPVIDGRDVADGARELQVQAGAGLLDPFPKAGRPEGGAGAGGLEHASDMLDIGRPPPEGSRQRQGRRDQASVLAGEEGADEVAVGLGDQADPVARLQARGEQSAAQAHGLIPHIAIGQGFDQLAARRIDIHAGADGGRVVQRLGDGAEVGLPEGAIRGCRRRSHQAFKLGNGKRCKCSEAAGVSLRSCSGRASRCGDRGTSA